MLGEPLAGQRVWAHGQGCAPCCTPRGRCVWPRRVNVSFPRGAAGGGSAKASGMAQVVKEASVAGNVVERFLKSHLVVAYLCTFAQGMYLEDEGLETDLGGHPLGIRTLGNRGGEEDAALGGAGH